MPICEHRGSIILFPTQKSAKVNPRTVREEIFIYNTGIQMLI